MSARMQQLLASETGKYPLEFDIACIWSVRGEVSRKNLRCPVQEVHRHSDWGRAGWGWDSRRSPRGPSRRRAPPRPSGPPWGRPWRTSNLKTSTSRKLILGSKSGFPFDARCRHGAPKVASKINLCDRPFTWMNKVVRFTAFRIKIIAWLFAKWN